ncbi:MAG: membrane protein insertase YidC, partial [Gammaproteobacteria bacterium]
LSWTGPDGVTVTRTYVLHRGQFVIDVRHEVHNASNRPWAAQLYRQLVRVNTRHGRKLLPTYLGAAWYDGKYHKLKFEDMSEEPLQTTLKGGWVAMLEHYFVSAWIGSPERAELAYSRVVHEGASPRYLVGMRDEQALQVPAGGDGRIETRLYVGPKLQKHLAEVAPGLELTTDYGMFTVFAKPLFWLLSFVHEFVGNWGWSIIIVTILLKLAFYRLSAASYRSMARMRAVQPKLQALKERYGDDKQRMNQELMALYKKEKINPLGGCLPMLVQIPVFIGFYWMLLETVELRQAPFILWIRDLSTMDPYFVLPILMGLSMIVQQKLNPAPLDPIQQKVMMAMPIVFTVFFAFFPSGLVLYWLTNNILSIAQQWWIMRHLGQESAKA